MASRKDFLAATALGALAPAAAAASTPAPDAKHNAKPAGGAPHFAFDLASFDAALATQASHKHLFTATKIDGGTVFEAMRNTLKAYRDIGIAWTDVLPVAVLYHGASIALGFDDSIWKSYFLPVARKHRKSPDDAVKDVLSIVTATTTGNPAMQKQGGDWDSSIPSLVADAGARIFICNNATGGFASYLARETGKHEDAVYEDLAHHLVPGAMLVPAGVWAVHAVQERRFTLLEATL
ncbi:MAG TPA: hypothetical protein VGN11_08920 [Candidatus Baltobacteraceae bacterium]|jgi:hypothetical protein|nr:hypothetical protein [Candidatus Baltobacteraceae bacterium]